MSLLSPTPNERENELARMLAVQQESDRGCVIVCAALLEDDLEKLLRAHCQQDANVVKHFVDPLFRVYAPFSTFSAKIQVSYAMGLIRKQTHTTLDLIRRVRNDFAHERKSVSFQTPKYQSRLRAIVSSAQPESGRTKRVVEPDDDAKMPGFGNLTKREFIDRLSFCLCVTRISVQILVACEH